MRFKFLCLFCGIFAVNACGARLDKENKASEPEIGFLTYSSQSSLDVGGDVVFLDQRLGAIARFEISPLKYVETKKIPIKASKVPFLAASDGRYFVFFSEKSFASVSQADGKTYSPSELTDEKINLVAFSSSHDLLVVWDDLGINAMKLSEQGEFLEEFRGSSDFSSNKPFVSATMLNDGRLLVAVGESQLLLIDVSKSIEAGDWVSTPIDLTGDNGGSKDASSMSWMAASPVSDDLVLVKDSDRVLLVDLSQEKVIDEYDIGGKTEQRASRNGRPHILTSDSILKSKSKSYELHYINSDGGLGRALVSNIKSEFLDSYFTSNLENILIRVGEEKAPDLDVSSGNASSVYQFIGSVYQYKLSNGNYLNKTEVDDKVRVHMADDALLLHYDSPLGKLEKRKYGESESTQEINFFNLEYLRKNR